jgi:diguanylate cyclase (GGDEF)-like protein
MDQDLALSVVDAGAQDFLIKEQDNRGSLARSVRFAIRRKKAELRLQRQAQYDPLTGLPNRRLFDERLERGMLRAMRHGNRMAVLFMDMDHFKHVNDHLGHQVGDGLLREVAMRLSSSLRSVDTVARFGGDEFAMVLEDLNDADCATTVARNILGSLRHPIHVDGNVIQTAASIGIAMYPEAGTDSARLLRNADTAMYAAKSENHDEFTLHYQPQYSMDSAQLVGFEALMRWNPDRDGSLVLPAEFIPLAESNGFIVPLGEWAIHSACAEVQRWNHASDWNQRISVNVSARQLESAGFLESLDSILRETGLPANRLELELTESSLIQDPASSAELLRAIRGRGVSLALDDFGTGYCSLTCLKELPVQRLKIDQSFVSGLAEPLNTTLVSTIISMAHALDLSVVAEGVETANQLEVLRKRGADTVQGFLMGRPESGHHASLRLPVLRATA